MAISPRAPLLARVVLALPEPLWGLDVARPTWREKRGEKRDFVPFHDAALGFPPEFGGLAGSVGWKRGTKRLPCPFKSLCWCNGILDLATA